MAMSIRNDELEVRVRELARVSGQSLTGALRLAVDNELQRREAEREARYATAMAAIGEIHARLAKLPKLGDFTDHDLYDEYGLPA